MNDISLITRYFPDITTKQKEQFAQLPELYDFWNAQINVVSRKDLDNLMERHVLHSLGIAKACAFANGSEILDVGTGGGFPGIPLAILFPNAQFHLVDSIGKKIKVVSEVAQALGLENVRAEHERAEKADGIYDFVVSRAVTRMQPFLSWIQNKMSKNQYNTLRNGVLYLKGGDLAEELAETKRKYKLYELSGFFEGEFFETKKVVYIPLT